MARRSHVEHRANGAVLEGPSRGAAELAKLASLQLFNVMF